METENHSDSNEATNKGNQYRVLISADANDSVDTLLKKVNEGWDAGKVTKPQLVSWVISKMAKKFSEKELNEVRTAHFDKIAYLESLLKKAKETGEMPAELNLLAPESISVGKAKKTSKPDSI